MKFEFDVPAQLGEPVFVIKKKNVFIKTEKCEECVGRGEVYDETKDIWRWCPKCDGRKTIEIHEYRYIVSDRCYFVGGYAIRKINEKITVDVELCDSNDYYVQNSPIDLIFPTEEAALIRAKELEASL